MPVEKITSEQIERSKEAVRRILDDPVIAAQMKAQSGLSKNYVFLIGYRYDGINASVTNGQIVIDAQHRNGHNTSKSERAQFIASTLVDNKEIIFAKSETDRKLADADPKVLQKEHGERIAACLENLAYVVRNERAQTGFAATKDALVVTYFP